MGDLTEWLKKKKFSLDFCLYMKFGRKKKGGTC